MTSSKSTAAEDRDAEARTFIRLQLGGEVARAASHIRSKRAAALRAGIEESRALFQCDYGQASVRPFLECVEGWLTERGNMVAAAALRTYLESDSVSYPEPQTGTMVADMAETSYGTRHPHHDPAFPRADAHRTVAGGVSDEQTDAVDAVSALPPGVADPSLANRQPPSASRPRRPSDTSRTTRSYRSSRSH